MLIVETAVKVETPKQADSDFLSGDKDAVAWP
jgi:hypothetical protein